MQDLLNQSIDPLERLGPLVKQSTFNAPKRFTNIENETVLSRDAVLISATDCRGKITFANNSFLQVCEYEIDEILGQPHNIIRHPDMPKTAFKDLWNVLQKGKIWQGFVKNRTKSHNYYWVKATVFPCFEKNKLVGYLSIRTKATHNEIANATKAYRLLP